MIESDTACSRWSLYTIGGNVPYTRGAGIGKASETLPQGYKLSCVMTVSLHWACSRLQFFLLPI